RADSVDRVLLVGRGPAAREGELEAQLRVEEQVVPEESFPRVVAEDQAVQASDVRLALDPGAAQVLGHPGQELLDALPAVLRVRVRGEPFGHAPAAGGLADRGEHPEDAGPL